MSYSNTNNISIALDAMGGDFAPLSVIHGADLFFNNMRDKGLNVSFHIYGSEKEVLPLLRQYRKVNNNSEFIPCSNNVLSSDKPSFALRSRKDSSMSAAVDSIKSGKVSGIVSSGNTGALMAISRFNLGMLPNVNRPAIVSLFPSKAKNFVLLDIGANVDCNAEVLFQFALMGNIFAKVALKIDNPKVALLNIGVEEVKGSSAVRGAFDLLQDAADVINFHGYVEAGALLEGSADVVVADGFVGNVLLKTAEAIANTFISLIKEKLSRSFVLNMLLKSMFSKTFSTFNPKVRNGAMFLGLNGVVVKSHGNSDAASFAHAINFAVDTIRDGLNQRIVDMLSNNVK